MNQNWFVDLRHAQKVIEEWRVDFDYGFYAAKRFGKLNRGVLLPKEPATEVIEWLQPLEIGVIWRTQRGFRDNAAKRFV